MGMRLVRNTGLNKTSRPYVSECLLPIVLFCSLSTVPFREVFEHASTMGFPTCGWDQKVGGSTWIPVKFPRPLPLLGGTCGVGRNVLKISIDHGMTLCGCWGDFRVIAKFEPILDM